MIDTWHNAIRVSRFVLSTLKLMQRIALDTIGPLPIAKHVQFHPGHNRCIYYIELYPTMDVTAGPVTDAL